MVDFDNLLDNSVGLLDTVAASCVDDPEDPAGGVLVTIGISLLGGLVKRLAKKTIKPQIYLPGMKPLIASLFDYFDTQRINLPQGLGYVAPVLPIRYASGVLSVVAEAVGTTPEGIKFGVPRGNYTLQLPTHHKHFDVVDSAFTGKEFNRNGIDITFNDGKACPEINRWKRGVITLQWPSGVTLKKFGIPVTMDRIDCTRESGAVSLKPVPRWHEPVLVWGD